MQSNAAMFKEPFNMFYPKQDEPLAPPSIEPQGKHRNIMLRNRPRDQGRDVERLQAFQLYMKQGYVLNKNEVYVCTYAVHRVESGQDGKGAPQVPTGSKAQHRCAAFESSALVSAASAPPSASATKAISPPAPAQATSGLEVVQILQKILRKQMDKVHGKTLNILDQGASTTGDQSTVQIEMTDLRDCLQVWQVLARVKARVGQHIYKFKMVDKLQIKQDPKMEAAFEKLKDIWYINQQSLEDRNCMIRTLSDCQLRILYPDDYCFSEKVAKDYYLSTCNSDSSSSIFLLPFIAIIPIHMEIPIFIKGKKVSVFKMMAKVIGKNGIFLKQIKINCADSFPNKIYNCNSNNMGGQPGQNNHIQNLRIELTKVFSSLQMEKIQNTQDPLMQNFQYIQQTENSIGQFENQNKEKIENSNDIEYYQNIENLQICHIQIASKDAEIFEYAIEQVREHVGHVYAEYMDHCKRVWVNELSEQGNLLPSESSPCVQNQLKRDMLVQKIAIKPTLQKTTFEKLAGKHKKNVDQLRQQQQSNYCSMPSNNSSNRTAKHMRMPFQNVYNGLFSGTQNMSSVEMLRNFDPVDILQNPFSTQMPFV